jgi:mannose-6-phosphate isomerase-like protein (cupin superfamily)
MNLKNVAEQQTHPTVDGSAIRSLFNTNNSPVKSLSVAEASLPPNSGALLHHHVLTTEIYFVLEGSGSVEVAGQSKSVKVGDAVLILPSQPHRMISGKYGIRFLCCCSPPFSREDTVLD